MQRERFDQWLDEKVSPTTTRRQTMTSHTLLLAWQAWCAALRGAP